MTESNAEKLVKYVNTIPDFIIYEKIDGNYNHIGATVADAILQANNNYTSNVKPRIKRILDTYPKAKTTSSLFFLLEKINTVEFLNWNGEDRAKRFLNVLSLLSLEKINTEIELKNWLSDDNNLPKLRAIKGIGPKTIDYFKILVGISTSAIDRHLLNFLKMAGLTPSNYYEAQIIINSAADILSVKHSYFDHSIWQFMSRRTARASIDRNPYC